MLEVERFEKIMEYLREKKTAPVNVLAKRLFVSEATMRRDLSELERKGLVKRLHGGAILLDGANQELPLYLRERQNTDAKRIISEKASHHIVEGDIKQKTSPPYAASFFLLIPDFAICVSVTMQAPFRIASFAFSTTPSEKQRLSA